MVSSQTVGTTNTVVADFLVGEAHTRTFNAQSSEMCGYAMWLYCVGQATLRQV